jgi:hypothetical protein
VEKGAKTDNGAPHLTSAHLTTAEIAFSNQAEAHIAKCITYVKKISRNVYYPCKGMEAPQQKTPAETATVMTHIVEGTLP